MTSSKKALIAAMAMAFSSGVSYAGTIAQSTDMNSWFARDVIAREAGEGPRGGDRERPGDRQRRGGRAIDGADDRAADSMSSKLMLAEVEVHKGGGAELVHRHGGGIVDAAGAVRAEHGVEVEVHKGGAGELVHRQGGRSAGAGIVNAAGGRVHVEHGAEVEVHHGGGAELVHGGGHHGSGGIVSATGGSAMSGSGGSHSGGSSGHGGGHGGGHH